MCIRDSWRDATSRADPSVPVRRAGPRAGDPMTTPGPDSDSAVRLPAVAGSFYPADPARLGRMAAGMLAGATPQAGAGTGASAATGTPLGILVPHAGLAY